MPPLAASLTIWPRLARNPCLGDVGARDIGSERGFRRYRAAARMIRSVFVDRRIMRAQSRKPVAVPDSFAITLKCVRRQIHSGRERLGWNAEILHPTYWFGASGSSRIPPI